MGIGKYLSSFNPIKRLEQRIEARLEQRAAQSYTQIKTAQQYLNVLGLYDNSSGEYVSNDAAMRIATAFTCVDVRSSAVGMLPANPYRYPNQNSDRKEIAYDHWTYRVFHVRPNPWQTPSQFWKLVVQRVDLEGDCFAYITRTLGMERVDVLNYSDVVVSCGEHDNNPYYEVKGKAVAYSDVLHFKEVPSKDGKRGLSKIELHQETFGSAKRQKKYSNRSLNVVPPFYLGAPGNVNIKDEGIKSVKEKLQQQTSDYFDDGTLPVLTNGMEVKTVGLKPVDAAYLEQINATKEDIFGIFRVPPAIAGAFKTGVTYNNLEQQNLQFLIYSMSGLLKNIEEEVNEKAYTTREQGRYFMKFNVGALLRTDLKSQAEWLSAMFKLGVYSRDEIRDILDKNPLPGGDRYYIEGNNMTALDDKGNVVINKPPAEPATKRLSDDVKLRLKEKFNGHSAEIINFFEQ
jgi:HK97 family phage portal protein